MPGSALEQLLQMAVTHHQAGRLTEAESLYREILSRQSHHADALHLLGVAASQSGRHEEAVAFISQAIALAPHQSTYHFNLGEPCRRLGRIDDAIQCFRRALTLQPHSPETWLALGAALNATDRYDESIESSRSALSLRPDYADAWNNLGSSHLRKGEFTESLQCYRRASALRPDHADAHWNIATLLLLTGDYEHGWKEYEWRLALPDAPPSLEVPRWDGRPAPGRTILLRAEQGSGDTLQFARYLPLVRERIGAARLILECQPELVPLLRQSDVAQAEVVAPTEGSLRADVDTYLPLLSLPLVLNQTEPFSTKSPYLRSDEDSRAIWRHRLAPRPSLRVGLVWKGNPNHQHDRLRSIAPHSLLPLLRSPGVTFYSLQVPTASDPILQEAGLIDLSHHLAHFADTAAFVSELDLIISVDTATAHLAGALGHPVWTLLPFVPDWRWGLHGETTPWYPSMRLFRQTKPRDWDTLLQIVTQNLSIQASTP